MKNMFKNAGVVALVMVIGFSMVACDTTTSSNNNGGGSGDVKPQLLKFQNLVSAMDDPIIYLYFTQYIAGPPVNDADRVAYAADFAVTINGNSVPVKLAIDYNAYLCLFLDTTGYRSSTDNYTIKIVYTANPARQIKTDNGSVLGSFEYTAKVKGQSNAG